MPVFRAGLFVLRSGLFVNRHALFRPCTTVGASNSSHKFLNSDFSLPAEWGNRLGQLSVDELGGANFEWLIAVQKKFSSGGKASAVDLDLACSVPVTSDQIGDLVDLCYKLRHTNSAPDLLPSTEYTVCRLLLESGDLDTFMKLLNDPINYGIFPNEHICCLFLDHFLCSARVQYAAKLATYVVLQELFDFPLLNFLATRALLEWTELPNAERIFDDQIHPKVPPTLEEETNFNEENVRLFRYPFLKNPHWDGHFDQTEADQLAGNGNGPKPRDWRRRFAPGGNARVESSERDIIRAAVLLSQQLLNFAEATEKQTEDRKSDESTEEREELALKELIEQKSAEFGAGNTKASDKLSAVLAMRFRPISREKERQLLERQRKDFREWARHRKELIHSQAQRAEHLARLSEVRKRAAELREEKELLHFFENRVRIEDEARERTELIKELGLMKKKGELTEEEYAQGIFHLARRLKEGKTAKQALEEISGSDLFSRVQSRAMSTHLSNNN
uniref:Uncharacterized protein n=1 Tax=Globodera rostochiensis TaxID=31243 RepID=A0A914HEG4_GLORO